jgi:DNA-binding response OmpR family regulator
MPARQGETGGAVSKRRGKCVLCVGSDNVHLNLRCGLLAEHGFNVLTASSGYEGIIRFGREKVDVVVVDLNDDGVEAALITGELKRLRPQVPVVMVVTDGKDLVDGATQQADAVVAKSQEALALVDALRSLLSVK